MANRPFLFGGNSPANAPSKYLVEFKAGKMEMKGSMVHPIRRKGTVFVNQSDDNLIHFCWKDRSSGSVEDDLIVFPEDAEFRRVAQCSTGRVYVLKFKSSARRCFYWMQDAKEEKDEELCKKVNEYLNHPPAIGSRSAATGGPGSAQGGIGQGLGSLANFSELANESELQNLLNNMNPQQLMQMLGGVGLGNQSAASLAGLLGNAGGAGGAIGTAGGGSARTRNPASATPVAPLAPAAAASANQTSPSSAKPPSGLGTAVAAVKSPTSGGAAGTGGGSSTNPAIQLSDLQSIISGLNVPPAGAGFSKKRDEVHVDLSTAINSEALKTLLGNEDFMKRVKTELPPSAAAAPGSVSAPGSGAGDKTPLADQVSSTVRSPQFQSALSIFSNALQSGQLGPLMRQFGLSNTCVAAADNGDLEGFVKALEESEGKKKVETKTASDAKKKEDNPKGDDKKDDKDSMDMALD